MSKYFGGLLYLSTKKQPWQKITPNNMSISDHDAQKGATHDAKT